MFPPHCTGRARPFPTTAGGAHVATDLFSTEEHFFLVIQKRLLSGDESIPQTDEPYCFKVSPYVQTVGVDAHQCNANPFLGG